MITLFGGKTYINGGIELIKVSSLTSISGLLNMLLFFTDQLSKDKYPHNTATKQRWG